MAVTHFTVNFRFRNKCGNRVDNDYVKRTASYKCLGNIQSLFTRIRLCND